MDFGHTQAHKNLIELEKQMEHEYTVAYSELKRKATEYFKRFSKADAEKVADLTSGKITLSQYKEWRRNQMLTGKRYDALVTSMSVKMTQTNQSVMKMIKTETIKTFMENYNYGGYEVAQKLGENFPFTLYNERVVNRLVKKNPKLLPDPTVNIPADRRWNRRKMNSALTQGILQGDSISKIADRLMTVTTMNRVAALRNARTMTTGAENAGRLESYKYAESLGIELQKKWVATLDHVTRDSHVDVDGEVQELDHPFSNGLDYPGGMGPPEEVYNCRCTMVSEIKGHKYKDERYSKLGNMSYEDWKSQHAAHRAAVEERRSRRAKDG